MTECKMSSLDKKYDQIWENIKEALTDIKRFYYFKVIKEKVHI